MGILTELRVHCRGPNMRELLCLLLYLLFHIVKRPNKSQSTASHFIFPIVEVYCFLRVHVLLPDDHYPET
jgi:hypothetical protein